MSLDVQVYTVPALLTGTISLVLAVYVYRRQSPVFDTRGLVAYLVTSGVISLVFVSLILAQEKSVMVFLLNVAFTLLVFGALSLLHFSLAFARRIDALTRRTVVLLGTVSALIVGAIWTDHIHHTFRADVELYTEPVRMVNAVYGPTGQFSVLYLFALALVSAYFILTHLFRSETLYRIQGLIVATAVVLPITGSALSLVNWPSPAINVTPVFTVVSGVLYTVAITRYGFLDTVPLAHEEVVNNMDDYLVVTDPTGTVLSLNARAETLIDDPDPVGRPVGDLLPLARKPPDGVTDGEGRWEDEITVEREDTRVLDVRSVPIRASDGRFLGRAITLRDITELKERERRLEKQNEQLDQFASMVSHDLRNPLNIAQLRAELIIQERDDENAEAIQDALTRMETMIDEMLTLARSGQEIETTEQCFLGELVTRSWENVHTDGAELDSRIEDVAIQADVTRLLHVFENLFRNAVEHNERPVTVRVGTLDGGEGFYVEDSGGGIPEDERDDIFSHGYTTGDGGNGLGLAIVGDIVEAHGWRITVTESEDGGARFEVRMN
ncbi:MAG: histidine kinase N-terminal 7TM domain-containing protein [Halovenus sp.]